MLEKLIPLAVVVFILSRIITGFMIKFSLAFGLVDHPDYRKRHHNRTPITGGLSIFLSLLIGMGIYAAMEPSWLKASLPTLIPISMALFLLIGIGIWDDIKGLGPYPKLLVQIIAAVTVLWFEPNIHAVLVHWEGSIGPTVWLLGILWLVGITNSINLVDGMDGLAGGMTLLVSISLFILSYWSVPSNEFALVATAILVPSILGFLGSNWNPARIFLGDNGSLPLGFLLGALALTARPQNKSWIMFASVILMLGYPILDTATSSFQRLKKRLPVFKADRNHLHHRLQALGLSVKRTAVLLLSIGLFLQVAALAVNLMSPPSATLGITLISFSIFSILFLVETLEKIKIQNAVQAIQSISENQNLTQTLPVLRIDLTPILSVSENPDIRQFFQTRSALCIMLSRFVRKNDQLLEHSDHIDIVLVDLNPEDSPAKEAILTSFHRRIADFLNLYDVNCSLSSLPISIELKDIRIDPNTQNMVIVEKQVA